ncbi:MAG: hypothetical protein ACYTCN_08220 [Planctomycetota bacterium]|jgi:hypothetical protein
MKKETKFVTVYWSEIVHMKNTIEVDKDEDDEEYMFQKAIEQAPRMCGSEIETDSIEVVQPDE